MVINMHQLPETPGLIRIEVPIDARFFSAGVHAVTSPVTGIDSLAGVVWYSFTNPYEERATRTLLLAWAGDVYPNYITRFLGTYELAGLVFHVFEVLS
jgi:hypothetical protein